MVAAAFDTLEFARRLGDGGFTSEQAQTAASALSSALEIDFATKSDLERVRLELDARITEVRLTLEAKISDSKWETIRWMIGIVGFQSLALTGALFALIKLAK